MPTPLRTCIGCRAIVPAAELVRFVLRDGRPIPCAGPRLPRGRGASLHPRAACVAAALKTGAFGRAFRARVEAPDASALLDALGVPRAP